MVEAMIVGVGCVDAGIEGEGCIDGGDVRNPLGEEHMRGPYDSACWMQANGHAQFQSQTLCQLCFLGFLS